MITLKTFLPDFMDVSLFLHRAKSGNPLQCSCLENPRDGGAWWAAVSGVAQSWTRLNRLSSSSSPIHSFLVPVGVVWLDLVSPLALRPLVAGPALPWADDIVT